MTVAACITNGGTIGSEITNGGKFLIDVKMQLLHGDICNTLIKKPQK